MNKRCKDLSGAWSASPTPLTKTLKIDIGSVKRMVKLHHRLEQKGIFLGGTCGEGPFISRDENNKLVNAVAKANKGKMIIATQVTDNSFSKVLDNISQAKDNGSDVAIVAEPWFPGPVKGKVLWNYMHRHYMEILEKSPLPIGIYSRGGPVVPFKLYREILMHQNVCLFKDSSVNDEIKAIALGVMKKRKDFTALTGAEFMIDSYLEAGYNGALAGGGIIIGSLTSKMIEYAKQGDFAKVKKLQQHCDRINFTAYGGKKIVSWLTGLKYTLVKMGIFKTTAGYLVYPLPDAVKKRIDKMVKKERAVLLP